VLHGLLISGELTGSRPTPRRWPPRAGEEPSVVAAVTVCLDAAGAAVGVLRRPSGLPSFDQAALAAVAAWRFEPYVDQGRPAPACGTASFGFAVGGPSPVTLPALPPREHELPPSIDNPGVLPWRSTRVRPHREVALASICRVPGATAAPTITWLQSSGDLATDRRLFERRETVAEGEAKADLPTCRLRAAIAPRPGRGWRGPTPRAPSTSRRRRSRVRSRATRRACWRTPSPRR
jgi:TonB family protein